MRIRYQKKHVLPIIFCEDISDHLPICAIVKCNPIEKTASRPLRRIISQDNIKLFLEDLSSALNTSEMRNSKNLEHLTLMNDLTNVYFPKKTSSGRQFKTSKILRSPQAFSHPQSIKTGCMQNI